MGAIVVATNESDITTLNAIKTIINHNICDVIINTNKLAIVVTFSHFPCVYDIVMTYGYVISRFVNSTVRLEYRIE